jgi:hypothetical protein
VKTSKANYENLNKVFIISTLNNLVNKCFENNKTIKTKTNNNTTNNINNTINNINVNLVPFGMENLDDLTPEEKKTILNAGLFCSVMCAKKLNCNPKQIVENYNTRKYKKIKINGTLKPIFFKKSLSLSLKSIFCAIFFISNQTYNNIIK